MVMILTDDDDDDDEGGRTRCLRRFPPFFVRYFQVDIPFNRVYESSYLLGLVCSTTIFCTFIAGLFLTILQLSGHRGSLSGCLSHSRLIYTLISCDVLFQVHK